MDSAGTRNGALDKRWEIKSAKGNWYVLIAKTPKAIEGHKANLYPWTGLAFTPHKRDAVWFLGGEQITEERNGIYDLPIVAPVHLLDIESAIKRHEAKPPKGTKPAKKKLTPAEKLKALEENARKQKVSYCKNRLKIKVRPGYWKKFD